MNTINEMIEVLQAYQRNEEIEWEIANNVWKRTTTPLWNFNRTSYRIKPILYEYWLVSYSGDFDVDAQEFNTKPDKNTIHDGAIVRHMREVME